MARPDPRRALGAAGEAAAARWYEERGYEVVARNWRCREGELDLVLRTENVLVFCEVKTRTSDRFGSPFEAVTPTKQARLRRLATRWMQAEAAGFSPQVRFDVASVLAGRLEVYEAAF